MSVPMIDVALDVFRSRDARMLDMDGRTPQFRKLESFLRKLRIEVRVGKEIKEKVVMGLVPNAGHFEFQNQDGVTNTIEVVCGSSDFPVTDCYV
jgi:hypothetical protein